MNIPNSRMEHFTIDNYPLLSKRLQVYEKNQQLFGWLLSPLFRCSK